MWSASSETTSAETGPLTSSQMWRRISSGSPSSLASRDGLVVAPESTPHWAISSTSETEPVSMKSLMASRLRGLSFEVFQPAIDLGADPPLLPAELRAHHLGDPLRDLPPPDLGRCEKAQARAPQHDVGERAGLLDAGGDDDLGEQIRATGRDRLRQLGTFAGEGQHVARGVAVAEGELVARLVA